MEEEGKLKPIKRSKFEEILTNEKVRLEAGLADELIKWFRNEKKRIDLELMLKIYMELYPETKLPPKKKKKGEKELVAPPSEQTLTLEEIRNLLVTPILDDLLNLSIIEEKPVEAFDKPIRKSRMSSIKKVKVVERDEEVKGDSDEANSQPQVEEAPKNEVVEAPGNEIHEAPGNENIVENQVI